MHKIRRNDPCLCGSGRKYKKCCSSSGSNPSVSKMLEREVVHIQAELLSHAFSHSAFKQAVQETIRKYNPSEEMRDSFTFFVGLWTLFTDEALFGNTALEKFCNSYKLELTPRVREIAQSWIGKAPSVVKVSDVDERNLVVYDIFSKDSKKVKIIDELTETPNEGALLIGYIVPFVDDVSIFFTSALSFEDVAVADKIKHFVRRKYIEASMGNVDKDASIFMKESFLGLVDLFMSDRDLELSNDRQTNAEWTGEQEAAVVNLLNEKIQSESMPESVFVAGNFLWQKYCLKKQPMIKNEKIYAAALHYLLVDKVFPTHRLTKKATAELYNASIGSVSSRSREMAYVLEEDLKEYC